MKPSYELLTLRVSLPQVLSLLVLVSGLTAQVGEHQPRLGFPQDWSHRHIVFNRQVMSEHPELANAEPRMLHQFMREMRRYSLPSTTAAAVVETSADAKRDWSVALTGGRIQNGMSPAVFVFNDSAPPSCAKDYAVFAINALGVTGGQASVIGFNNLYSGPGGICGAGGPSVLFAYNTTLFGGKIRTSPVVSLDGKKIAFVESGTTSSIFHVLTWTAGDGTSPTNSAVPSAMTSLIFDLTATDSISAPWVDYTNDVAYVGANDGLLYKITGVFTGIPTLAGAPWPITIGAGGPGKTLTLTAPVLDQLTKHLFVGDNRGFLWLVDTAAPATPPKFLAVGKFGKLNPSIIDAPIVDPANKTVIAISSNDGVSAVIVQADTRTLVQLARARIGQGSLGVAPTAIPLYDGTFSNDYFTDPSTGYILVCGTGAADATPWRYTFPFVGRVLQAAATSGTQILPSTTSRCSPISEVFNPNIGVAPGTDLFFWGMTQDCTAPGTGVAGGCVMSLTNLGVLTMVKEPGGTSAIVTDNFSPLGQASSIYFSDASTPRTAVKLTQNGLN